ncbi:MAG: hypothetical protein ABIJ53_04885, partial [Verrucomicrobiota bacterium]
EQNRYHPTRPQPTFPATEENLAKFRSCMQPHVWGIPVTFLAFDREAYIDAILKKGVPGKPTTLMGHCFGDPEECAAWCVVHDMSIQPSIKDHFRYAGLPHTAFLMRDIWDILPFGISLTNLARLIRIGTATGKPHRWLKCRGRARVWFG